MKMIILIILFITSSNLILSQSLTVFDLDTSNFPIMRAKFFSFDNEGNQLLNLSPSDFEITENGLQRTVTNVSCPLPKPLENVSVAMSIDVSGSMSASDFKDIPVELGKSTAKELCNLIVMPPSEFALQTCDSRALIIQDFTTIKNKIISAIEPITANGGNNFVEHLLNPRTGLFNVVKTGKYKKIAVIYTDAWWHALTEEEFQQCMDTCSKYNIHLFAVIYSRPEAEPNGIKSTLQLIADKTDGLFLDGITSEEAALTISRKMKSIAQGGEPCEIEWISEKLCVTEYKNIEFKLLKNGTISKNGYQLPLDMINKLEFSPPYISFKNAEPGIKKEFKVIVKAINSDFNITDIKSSDNSFSIEPKSFELKEENSFEITVSVIPPDSGYIFTEFNFINEICISKYYANAGYVGKKPKVKTLKIIHPNGSEVFVAGMDTVITWEGVLPDEKVKIEYTLNNGINWKIVSDTASGQKYNWKVPASPSNYCLARVTTKLGYDETEDDMVLIPAGKFLMGQTGNYKGIENIHEVTITKPFLMCKYEVTQQKWKLIMGNNPSNHVNDEFPIHNVNWIDAVEYCNNLSVNAGLQPCYNLSGKDYSFDINANGYRLPTEAEWEYACKAGTSTDYYSGGNMSYSDCSPVEPSLDDIAWYCGNSGHLMHMVGGKLPNKFGLFDMSGSIWEWCWDWYSTYPLTIETDPLGPAKGDSKILRGCSWDGDANGSQSASRYYLGPTYKNEYLGFRICRNL